MNYCVKSSSEINKYSTQMFTIVERAFGFLQHINAATLNLSVFIGVTQFS